MYHSVKDLPKFADCNEKKEAGERLSAAEQFILDNEPQDPKEQVKFRAELIALILEVQEDGDLYESIQCCA